MKKKLINYACSLVVLILPLLATCNAPFVFENPTDLGNPDYIHLTGLSLDREADNLVSGSSLRLTPSFTPAKAHDKRIEWTTSNAEVATVDRSGLVHGVTPGTAVIEARSVGKPAISASCTVTVVSASSKEITGFSFSGLASDLPVSIDHEDGTITVHVPYGTDRSSLVPLIVHTGATIQPAAGQSYDFTDALAFTVTDRNGDSFAYSVTVEISDALISFVNQSGSPEVLTRSVPYPSATLGAAAMPPEPSRTGYTFSGWWTEPNGHGSRFESTTTIGSSMTVHAYWLSQAKAMLSFGLLSPAATGEIDEASETISMQIPYGTSLENLVAIFTTTGAQVRIGDIGQVSGTTANDFSTPRSYTVVAEDGSTRSYVLSIQVATTGAKEITSFSFAIGGSVFSGTINNSTGAILVTVPFGTDRNGLVPAITHVGKSINYVSGIARDFSSPKSYTVWALDDTSRDYTVTVNIANVIVSFDADGGTPAIQTHMVEHPATTTGTLPGSPSRTGYSFSGWRTGRNGGGTDFLATTTITGDTTVYAHWIPDIYTIAYQLSGGTNHADNPGSYTIETATITLQAPSRTGYDFLGWYDNEAYTGDPITQLKSGSIGDRTYHAKWAAKSYTVSFDRQSGTGGSDEVSAIYDQPMPAATAPTRSNHTFGGYYTQAEGTGTQYYSESMASLRNWDLAADRTLYAEWIIDSYTVSYDGNGSSSGTVPVPGNHNYDAIVTVSEPGDLRGPTINSGITQRFMAWNTKADGTGTSYQPSDNFIMPADTVTLYAIWTSGTEVIGKVGPAGGKVFYDKSSSSNGWRYLEAWKTDQENTSLWKTSHTLTGGTSTAIGAGYANTYTAMAGPAHPAAEAARNTTHGGYSDWFLPSKNELYQMFLQRSVIGGFASKTYWSSSQIDTSDAWAQHFGTGSQSNFKKATLLQVRVVRVFRSENPLYFISYNANGATSGIVPIDSNLYEPGETGVPIASNSGNLGLTKDGFQWVFAGWNTEVDGSGTNYSAASTMTMPSGNVTLYAHWTSIGATGPVGGKVFYDKGSYSDGWRYLEAWTADQSGTYQWKTSNSATPGTSTDIGTGYANTYTAMAGTAHPAAEAIRTATLGGYSDWFLPSKNELNQMYIQRSVIGGIASDYYWSSSQSSNAFAWIQSLVDGEQIHGSKSGSSLRIRVVRAFRSGNPLHIVSYNANGATSGSVPVDYSMYEPGETSVPIAANSGSLTRSGFGFTFVGWNTEPDGSGTHYTSSSTTTMPSGNLTLYAEWQASGLAIGATGPAGGKVFYDKGSYSDGWRYLEAWTADQSGTHQWKTSITATPGTSTAIGNGYTNTYMAMAGTTHPAAEVARNTTNGGYSDWFLPSKDELNLMYGQKGVIGGFASGSYWCSSEYNNFNAQYQHFDGGFQFYSSKDGTLRVRVARRF